MFKVMAAPCQSWGVLGVPPPREQVSSLRTPSVKRMESFTRNSNLQYPYAHFDSDSSRSQTEHDNEAGT
jgi:hypothetical protein